MIMRKEQSNGNSMFNKIQKLRKSKLSWIRRNLKLGELFGWVFNRSNFSVNRENNFIMNSDILRWRFLLHVEIGWKRNYRCNWGNSDWAKFESNSKWKRFLATFSIVSPKNWRSNPNDDIENIFFIKLLFLFILIGEQALVHTFLPFDNRTDNLKCFIPAILSKFFEDVGLLLIKGDPESVLRVVGLEGIVRGSLLVIPVRPTGWYQDFDLVHFAPWNRSNREYQLYNQNSTCQKFCSDAELLCKPLATFAQLLSR